MDVTTDIIDDLGASMQSANISAIVGIDSEASGRALQFPTLAGGSSERSLDQPSVPFSNTDDLAPSTDEASTIQLLEKSNSPMLPVAPSFTDRLSNELWIMIIEETKSMHRNRLRLISRRFNALCIPLLHQALRTNPKLLSSQDRITLSVAEHFRRHARCVSVDQELDWNILVEQLSQYEVFQDLDWSYFPGNPCSLPAPIAAALRTNLAHVRLDLVIERAGDPSRTVSLASILAGNLIAFNTSIPTSGGSLGDFLVSAKRLQRLCLAGGGPIDFSAGDPSSLTNLILCHGHYHFRFNKPWNLPLLTSLCLERIDLVQYLRYVPGDTFPALRNFTVHETDMAMTGTPFFQQLVTFIEKLNSLESLVFGGYHDLTVTSKAIAKHGQTLTRLFLGRLWRRSSRPSPTLQASVLSHLKIIEQSCSKLKTLHVDATVLTVILRNSVAPFEMSLFPPMESLATFQTIYHVEVRIKSSRANILWENNSHTGLKELLRLHKLGVPFSRITLILCEQVAHRVMARVPFWASCKYSYDSKGEETAVIKSSTRVEHIGI